MSPLGPLDTALGAPLAATWAMSILSTVEVVQALRYFRVFNQDSLWRKACVVLVLTFDGIAILSAYIFTYLYTVSNWGDVNYLSEQHWPIATYLLANSFTEVSVQLFLIAKVYSIWRKAWVVALLCIGPVCVLGGAIATSVINLRFPAMVDRFEAKTAVTVWVTVLVATNCTIAGVLIWRLNTLRAEQAQFQITTRGNKLKHIMYSAWITGGVTSMISIILMVVYLCDEESNVPVALAGPLSSLYALVMLVNLNDRAAPTAPLNRHRVAPLGQHGQITWLEGRMEPSTNTVTSGEDLYRKGPDW